MRRGDIIIVKMLTGLFESFRFVGCREYKSEMKRLNAVPDRRITPIGFI
jgi:hypothetical protein